MFEELMENFYRIQVPLPQNPLKSVNCYLIKDDPPVLIDTGMNREECFETIKTAIESFGKPLVVATHLHADHLGLAGRIADTVYMSEEEVKYLEKLKNLEFWIKTIKFYIASGFPAELARLVSSVHPGIKFFAQPKEFRCVDSINAGGYEFEVIITPGHTPGHLCLYERSERVLISGDHVLFDVTPNIGWWPHFEDPLGAYIESLKKTRSLDARIVYPGHRKESKRLKERIDELIEHHKKRLEEVLSALNDKKTAWEVAQKVSWDIKFESWSKLPLMQKWFAVSETIAHLEHLVTIGEAERVEGESVYYKLR
ncbi:MAG: MBL fold metallo-hydrolase [Archaeoglobaceae archaeon]